MQRFSLKCQSGFLPLAILVILLGPLLALGVFLPPAAYAETAPVEASASEEPEGSPDTTELSPLTETDSLPVLPPVLVLGVPDETAAGPATLSQQEIERLPSRNSSVNELLLVLPGIQASDSANLSTQAGEIAPPALSISGGKTYQNNFQLDGQGINLILDPLNTADPADRFQVPSSAQSLLLNKRLFKEIEVLDHDISARYGGFTGGVVNAKTRDPEKYFAGDLFARTTRDSWSRFYVEDEEKFNNSTSSRTAQPRFAKYEAGLSLDLPLTEQSGLLASYQRLDSKIPLRHFDGKQSEYRQLENYFFKLVNQSSSRDRLVASLMSSPGRNDYFRSAVKNSAYSIDTDAVQLATEYQRGVGAVDFYMRGSYGLNNSARSGPLDFKVWNANYSPSKDWGKLIGATSSSEGGYGNITNRQETLQLTTGLDAERNIGLFGTHHIASGIDYAQIVGTYRRPETSYYYYGPKVLVGSCGGDAIACIDGEQFLSSRLIYQEDEAQARVNRIGVYAEDTMTLGRISVRPGVRISHDDYMRNTDIAPRFSTTLDLFGNQTTLITAGANRYYSETLLAGKLREAIQPLYRQTRSEVGTVLTPWGAPLLTTKTANRYSELKTPRVDELSTGIDQSFAGGRLALDYVHRKGEELFALKLLDEDASNQLRYNVLTNQGRTQYESWRLGWQRSWTRHDILANLTWQQTKSNAESYLDRLDDETLDQRVYYHGEFKAKRLLPNSRKDYNQAWMGNLVYTGTLPVGFEFTNVTRYRSGYQVVKDTGITKDDANGVSCPVYDEVEVSAVWLFDWIWTWRHPLTQHQELALSLEIYNVFDRKVRAGTSDDDYELGRQLWAGAEYRF